MSNQAAAQHWYYRLRKDALLIAARSGNLAESFILKIERRLLSGLQHDPEVPETVKPVLLACHSKAVRQELEIQRLRRANNNTRGKAQ
ncbi:hypothetical protein [Ralstonia insidiosa]|uniref:Uncharacterized protein n=1 Tax=Ralstonia insidiosa TaxID=190721 RepID=A0A848P739_9RALS|nr:hypothetical protein [Ralstonia insidiosa]NMV41155.1 hypothetical protein [Ralstonia insidiosa]